jgi:hypothetical protein
VDTRYHFALEFIEEGFIKIKFVCSAENDSGLFTKNVSQELYERHTKKFWKAEKITVSIDCYRIGGPLEISLTINHLVLHV